MTCNSGPESELPEVSKATGTYVPHNRALPEVGIQIASDESKPSKQERDKKLLTREIAGFIFFALGAILGIAIASNYTASQNASPTTQISPSERMAVVAGTPITRGQFNRQMEIQAGADVLKTMISEELTLQFARQRGLLPQQAEIQDRVRSVSANPAFVQEINNHGLTVQEVAHDCKIDLIREAIYGNGVSVTDKEAEDYYREQCDPKKPTSKFYTPEIANVSIIATVTLEDGIAAEKELKQGKPFAEVAKAYSKDLASIRGGEAPPAVRGRSVFSKLAPAFEKDVFLLKPGEWTRPRRVGDSKFWLLVKCNKIEPSTTIPFEEVKEQCRRQAAVLKAAKAGPTPLAREFEGFRHKARINVHWDRYYYPLTGKKPAAQAGR